MLAGTISSISADKGFGFIQPESGEADVFFHCTSVNAEFKSLTIGQQVQYTVDESSERPRAKNVIAGASGHFTRRPTGTSQSNSYGTQRRPPVAVVHDCGFVTKLHRRKLEGYISSDKGGPEYFFNAATVTGEKRFFQIVVGDYVQFVPQANADDPKQPFAKSVMVIERAVPTQTLLPPKHPRSLGKKPTWR